MRKRETASPIQPVILAQRIPRASEKLRRYCKDIDRWPQRWAVFTDLDIPVGERLAAQFERFLLFLVDANRSKKTIQRHAHYLWVLGGEILRRVRVDEKDRKRTARTLILKYVNATGGPLWNDPRYEREHKDYDAVCRQLYQFLTDDNS